VQSVSEQWTSVVSIPTRSAAAVSGEEEVSGGEAVSNGKAAAEPKSLSESVLRVQVKAVATGQPETTYRVSTVPTTFQVDAESIALSERQDPETGQLRQVVRLLESMSGSVEQVRVTAVSRPNSQAMPLASVEPAVAKATLGVTETITRPEIGSAIKTDPVSISTASTPEKGSGSGVSLSPQAQAKPVAASGYSVLREEVPGFQSGIQASPPQPNFSYNRTPSALEPVAPLVQPDVSTVATQDAQPIEPYRAVVETSQVSRLQREAVEIPVVRQALASAGAETVPPARMVNAPPETHGAQALRPGDATISSEASAEARMDRAPKAEAVDLTAGSLPLATKSTASTLGARSILASAEASEEIVASPG